MAGTDPPGLNDNPAGDGVTANDPSDADGGTNDLQNYPQIQSAGFGPAGTRITLTLDTMPSSEILVDFHATSACDGRNTARPSTRSVPRG
ncbi:MAG: hypothetical protein IT176_06435 [Acidobacteria bacterium]|nr:hypothetical protein [Acidobacteriota bacterium]